MIFCDGSEKYFFWSVFCANVLMDNKDGRKENVFPFNAVGSVKLIWSARLSYVAIFSCSLVLLAKMWHTCFCVATPMLGSCLWWIPSPNWSRILLLLLCGHLLRFVMLPDTRMSSKQFSNVASVQLLFDRKTGSGAALLQALLRKLKTLIFQYQVLKQISILLQICNM